MKASLQYKIGKFFLYITFRFLFGLKIEGVSNIPRKGAVIISPNHRSNYDPPLVGCCIDTRVVQFMGKSGLFTTKFSSWFLRGINVIPVGREGSVLGTVREFIRFLKEGKAIMVFPEGTRSKTGKYLEAQPGVGFLAIRTNTPVIPTFIRGMSEPLIKHFFRITPLKVKFGKPIYPAGIKHNLKEAKKFADMVLEEIKKLG
ncbi:1-acyl-sn-glycerol-3-phosphate acyltransferase [candidate division WOR-3 bacterium]|nr:1-acyl-sn-glycerol-3-phosphate acyltransferase [candidate division WOR-3 bacterium]